MSLQYNPADGASPNSVWGPLFLSNRDLSAQVPVNFVTHPGISITSACFSNRVYDTSSAGKCISNLLAAQFRRLAIDLYWDNQNRQFNLCPVQFPVLSGNSTSIPGPASTGPPKAVKKAIPFIEKRSRSKYWPFTGQKLDEDSSSTIGNTTSLSSHASKTQASSTPSTNSSDTSSFHLGLYTCSRDLNLQSIVDLYGNYLTKTADTIDARLQYLIFNLHLASSTAENNTITSGKGMPNKNELIGTQFSATIMKKIYRPGDLLKDRTNLNSSWLNPSTSVEGPLTEYFDVSKNQDGTIATQNGWPNEEWLLNVGNKRLFLGWGQIDKQMNGYDFQDDSDVIFPVDQLNPTNPSNVDRTGALQSQCYFEQSKNTLKQVNSSWASSTLSQTDSKMLQTTSSNLTSCGISQFLNETLGGEVAHINFEPYQKFAHDTVFGWSTTAPSDTSTSSSQSSTSQEKCAVIDSTSANAGHWRIENCQAKYRAACRIVGEPYQWQISSSAGVFGAASSACAQHTSFSAPRTGLENTYLYHYLLNQTQSNKNASLKSGIWINLNSLDTAGCWVTTGLHGPCPYANNTDTTQQQHVLIPTIAAIIVLIVSILTVLVKCNINRRNSKTHRRGEGGWDYEGVPS